MSTNLLIRCFRYQTLDYATKTSSSGIMLTPSPHCTNLKPFDMGPNYKWRVLVWNLPYVIAFLNRAGYFDLFTRVPRRCHKSFQWP